MARNCTRVGRCDVRTGLLQPGVSPHSNTNIDICGVDAWIQTRAPRIPQAGKSTKNLGLWLFFVICKTEKNESFKREKHVKEFKPVQGTNG